MIQRSGQVVIKMLSDLNQRAIKPIITETIAPVAMVMTDGYDIYAKLPNGAMVTRQSATSLREFARDEGGDGFCEVHVNTIEGFWSLLRSWSRPRRGISQESPPLHLGFFEFAHNVRKRGKALPGSLLALLLT